MATRIVCVFPGQGSQVVGMGKDLWEADDAVKALYQEANEALGYDLQRLCFAGPEDELRLTQNAQPAAARLAGRAQPRRVLRSHCVRGLALC